jgi:type IV secretion system protein VirB9
MIFGNTTALILIGAMAAAQVATSQAYASPRSAPGVSAVDTYDYVPDAVYPVRTGLGITTQIELDPNERVLDYSTGFTSGWELTRRDNVFYLKPKNVDVDTNLVVRTETNSYIFELKVVATDWRALEQARRAGVQYKIRFAYPQDVHFVEKSASREASASDKSEVAGLNTAIDKNRRYYYDYDYATRSKKAWLVPTSVYDDGQFTYIKMSDGASFPTGNFPSVYAREKARTEEFVVNTTVEGNTIILHGTYPFLVIRHGDNVVGLRRNPQK